MAGAQEDLDSKTYEPTARRLQQAREEGDSIRSEDMQAAASAFGILLAGMLSGGWALKYAGGVALSVFSRLDQISISNHGDGHRLLAIAIAMVAPLCVLFLGPILFVLIWLALSRGLVFATSKLRFRGSRLSLIGNFKQKFGKSGWVDFTKKSTKLMLISMTLLAYFRFQSESLFLTIRLQPGQVMLLLFHLIFGFLLLSALLTLGFGLIDYLWQRHEFLRRNRMSRKDVTDEMKESEGDPHMRADRRRRAQDVVQRRMLTDVPKADVVVVNPSHYAVALRWDRKRGRAPICVAKGQDEMAARIRALAQSAGVPIHRDAATARALHASIDVGREIRREDYAAVAAAIRFADAMRRRAKRSATG